MLIDSERVDPLEIALPEVEPLVVDAPLPSWDELGLGVVAGVGVVIRSGSGLTVCGRNEVEANTGAINVCRLGTVIGHLSNAVSIGLGKEN
jgi:hypothetical protein